MYITMIQSNESRILYAVFDKLAHKYEKDGFFCFDVHNVTLHFDKFLKFVYLEARIL